MQFAREKNNDWRPKDAYHDNTTHSESDDQKSVCEVLGATSCYTQLTTPFPFIQSWAYSLLSHSGPMLL